MSRTDFLVEIGTEELPPKALKKLSDAFTQGILTGLQQAGLTFDSLQSYASPRRLAVWVRQLDDQQPDAKVEKKGPAAKAAYDAQGNPSKALLGFASSCGASLDQLETIETPKGEWIVYRATQVGQASEALLPEIVQNSLSQLPIPKRMRWGASRVEFVRPVHWIIMLSGSKVIPCEIMGIQASNISRGHRFLAPVEIAIDAPHSYALQLEKEGKVQADFELRKEKIRTDVTAIAKTVNGQAVIDENLLDEVTALNEWPVPLIGRFEEKFLAVPAQALISSMKEHQKYFHVINDQGKMLPNFITISNIVSKDPQQVIAGNEKVIRPRLSDAAFFFETDKKTTLDQRVERLKSIVFQEKLGTLYDKIQRVSQIAGHIAGKIGGDISAAKRAGHLAKSDLVSEMVLEFPELQGIMGYHYALNDGEPIEVSQALDEQYMPRFAGDVLPATKTGCALSIAEKMDTIVGIFGINQPPTGTKDPFALRRAALGVLRIIVERELDLDLRECISFSANQHQGLTAENLEETVFEYMLDRFKAWYEDAGIETSVFMAVHNRKPSKPLDFHRRILAVSAFTQLPEAEALAAANKRVSNILSKQSSQDSVTRIHAELCQEAAEKELLAAMQTVDTEVTPLFEGGDYETAMSRLAKLKAPIDQFFDQVMVMVEDEAIRNNRLALLVELRRLFTRVADISLLQTSN